MRPFQLFGGAPGEGTRPGLQPRSRRGPRQGRLVRRRVAGAAEGTVSI